MCWRGPAATTNNLGTSFAQLYGHPAHVLWRRIVDYLIIYHAGQSSVGLGPEYRAGRNLAHGLHKAGVFGRILAAIGSYDLYQRSYLLSHCLGLETHHRPAMVVKTKGASDGKIGGAPGAFNGGLGLTQVTHGLNEKKIGPTLGQAACLLKEGANYFIESQLAKWLEQLPGRSHVARDQNSIGGYLASKFGSTTVDLDHPIVQAMVG